MSVANLTGIGRSPKQHSCMEYAGVSLIDQRDSFCYDGSDNRCRMFYDKGYIRLSYVFYGLALHINKKITD